MNTIYAHNIPQAYTEALIKMHMWGVEEDSRNGPVITSEDPVLLSVTSPCERVLFDSVRNCNPFFHVMEFVWMMAGANDVKWIEQFNKRFREFADTGTDTLHAAYGHRWRYHFDIDQIQTVGDMLRRDPSTRRAVISMWDPSTDLTPHNDLPCNTSIMFRIVDGGLDMTVANRSNDLVWGMLGANAVHMTYLHELIAYMAGVKIGFYRVFTNNLHVYKEMPNFKDIWPTILQDDPYRSGEVKPYPLLQNAETYQDLVLDCVDLMVGDTDCPRTFWAANVAHPMYFAYMQRLDGLSGKDHISDIVATDWRLACENYVKLRKGK